MSQYVVIICILSILLWFYFMKHKEQETKLMPIIIKQKDIILENKYLRNENKKIKLKLKYLQQYKNDISKTFKILDNELHLITDHIKHDTDPSLIYPQPPSTSIPQSTSTPLSSTPLSTSTSTSTPSDIFNNIFNNFLISREHGEGEEIEIGDSEQNPLHVSVNYVPLNGNYRRYLLQEPLDETEG